MKVLDFRLFSTFFDSREWFSLFLLQPVVMSVLFSQVNGAGPRFFFVQRRRRAGGVVDPALMASFPAPRPNDHGVALFVMT